MSLAGIVQKSHRLHLGGHVTEVTTARVFQVQGDHGTYAVVLAVDKSDAWCSCPTAADKPCAHVGAVLLAIREEDTR